MIKTSVFDLQGKETDKIVLPEWLFGVKVNRGLMAQAVRVYLSNQRTAHAKSKNRGEVLLTTKKWFKQKGTGRARHGAKSAPIFVGGSKAHGPTGMENYTLKLSKKMKKKALASAMTYKYQEQEIKIVKGLDKLDAKTKAANSVVAKLDVSGKFILIDADRRENVVRAFRNLNKGTIRPVNQLNTYEVLNGGILLMTVEAINWLNDTSGKSPAKVGVQKKVESKVSVSKKSMPPVKVVKKTTTKKTVKTVAKKKPATVKNSSSKKVKK